MRELIEAARRRRAVAPLVAALEHPVATVREAAAAALGALEDAQAVAPLTGALRDHHAGVRAAARAALARIDPGRMPEAAVEALPHADPDARVRAASGPAADFPRRASGKELIAALGAEDALVRARAASELGARRDRRAVEPLTALLKREDPGSSAQLAAAAALERLGAGLRSTHERSTLPSPLVLWGVGMALFALAVMLASTAGMGTAVGIMGVGGFAIMLGAGARAMRRRRHQGYFWLGDDVAGREAVWLGSGADGRWGDLGGGDIGGGGGGGGW
jgi:HEAT repeats/PBS lyase HEAT-like repeat